MHQEKKERKGDEPRNAVFSEKAPYHQLTNYQLIKPGGGAERNHPEMVQVR